MNIKLLETVESTCKKGLIYGIAGQRVTILAVRGHVLLVQDSKGKTFPVNRLKTDYQL